MRQRIGRRAAQPARGVRQAQHVADDALGLVQERTAALGHLDAARRAAEQRKADLVLQQADLLADGGLRDVEPRRRLGEAALLGDRQRVADLAKFQALTITARRHMLRVLWKFARRRGDHSDFAPENLITFAHLSVSSAMNLPKSAGETGKHGGAQVGEAAPSAWDRRGPR